MKLSVSIPDDDVRFLDDYAREQGLDSRSAALHRAVRLLRTAELAAAYGVSRKTGYKWLAQYEAAGARGLQDRSRRPHHHPQAIDAALVEAMLRTPALARLTSSIAFIEQPLDRAIALDPAATDGLAALGRRLPMLIDESDDALDAFPRAVALGYRGVSTKNCKGIVKSFLNRSLVERDNRRRAPAERLFMSAEDLTNVPVVPLQQDLATVRALGITHVERNGHHYVRGLAHCSAAERREATRRHADLYTGDEDQALLRITQGRLDVRSLAVPGYGVAFEPDLDAMIPLENWTPASLEDTA